MSSPAPLVYDVEKVDPKNAPTDTEIPTGGIPIEVETTSAIPPSSLNGLTIASIILTICGVGLGLGAGSYTTASYDEFNTRQSNDRLMAQLLGFLGIATFATSIPLLACGARQYQNQRSGSKGLPVLMIIAWIAYGLGMMDAVILLGYSILSPGYVQPAWVYLAILYNVIPFFLMLAHAEYSRRR